MKLRKREIVFYAIMIFAAVLTAVLLFTAWGIKNANEKQMLSVEKGKKYKYHYMLIQNRFADERSENLYTGAKEAGEKLDILVEDAGKFSSKEETAAEMMNTAIAAKVDGIILESEGVPELQEMIDMASEHNIPVAVVGKDMIHSKRKCFVGVDVKQAGAMYAHRIQENYEGKPLKAAVFTDCNKADSPESVYYYIDQETANKNIKVYPVDINGGNAFGTYEKIRALFLNADEVPDVVVCLNEIDTICAYKAAIDYNMVGKIKIIAYSAQEEVMAAIEKGIIDSSIMIDLNEMGKKAVESLYEVHDKRNTVICETVEPRVLDKTNIDQYRKEK